MKCFYNLKIGTKLVAAFALVGAITAFVGYMGIRDMATMNKMAKTLYGRDLMGISYIREANVDLNYLETAEKNLLLSTKYEDREKYKQQIDEARTRVEENIAKAKPLLYTEEDKALMATFEACWKQRLAVLDRVVELSLHEQRQKEAVALSFGEGRKTSAVVDNVLTQLVTFKKGRAHEVAQTATNLYKKSRLAMILLVVGGVIVGSLLGLFISRMISRPVGWMVDVLDAVAAGDLTQRLHVRCRDEIGQIAEALNRSVEKMGVAIASIASHSEVLASSSGKLSVVSTEMSSNAARTSSQSDIVSATGEQVSKNMETVATSIDEMSGSIKEIASNASEAARVAASAVETAGTVNRTVAKLGESSAEIGQVIKVITSIAQQTNLLALNATIEAARAGAAGKGFAVVANEVKELAKETAKATEDISRKIEAIQGNSQAAVDAIYQITGIIGEINDISNAIAAAVEEQTVTSNEIARNINQAAEGNREIVGNIRAVAMAANDTTQAANQTKSAASELSSMATELQELVGQFQSDSLQTHRNPDGLEAGLPEQARSSMPLETKQIA